MIWYILHDLRPIRQLVELIVEQRFKLSLAKTHHLFSFAGVEYDVDCGENPE
jgi:hypothetical protein